MGQTMEHQRKPFSNSNRVIGSLQCPSQGIIFGASAIGGRSAGPASVGCDLLKRGCTERRAPILAGLLNLERWFEIQLLWRVPIYFFSNFELFPRDMYLLFSLVWIVASVFVIAIWNLNLHSVYVFYLLILLRKEKTTLPKKHYYSKVIFAVAIDKTFI